MELVAACERLLRFLASRKQFQETPALREYLPHNPREARANRGGEVLRSLPARVPGMEGDTRHPQRDLHPDLTSVHLCHLSWRARWVVRSLMLTARNLVQRRPRQLWANGGRSAHTPPAKTIKKHNNIRSLNLPVCFPPSGLLPRKHGCGKNTTGGLQLAHDFLFLWRASRIYQ